MHHKRIVQEKDKLLKDLSQLRKHLRGYEPTIEELKRRHETGMKDKVRFAHIYLRLNLYSYYFCVPPLFCLMRVPIHEALNTLL